MSDVHGWAEYPHFCGDCKAQQDEEAADRERGHAATIDQLASSFFEQAHEALSALNALHQTVTRMASNEVYDVEMAEGPAGDVLADLETVSRTLRHVGRIARWRRDLALKTEG
jgi:hypothetical protein